MSRINKLCSYLFKCNTFADIGCDHGYCTEYMLKNGLCQKAVISDISAKSLQKAEKLLKNYVESGICTPVCCDGLEKIDKDTDLILIAGMGGEEIIKILKNSFIPKNFVFQPMKNWEELRRYLIENGAHISVDDVFCDDKYYFIIKGEKFGEKQNYSQAEYKFGKDALNNPVLYEMLKKELLKKQEYLSREEMSQESKKTVEAQVKYIKEVISGEIK
ncbi:MAG: SAM-dependent methyltransferase [Clostridia bacterium]|nr:SAM-dependent methyltransferase [Clostridia bacterium]